MSGMNYSKIILNIRWLRRISASARVCRLALMRERKEAHCLTLELAESIKSSL
jgi:hypothetical protein